MKRFVSKLFWFILPILVIAYPLDLFISYNLKKLNDKEGETEIWNDIYEGKANCDIAIYGSSRASSLINPRILEDTLHQSVYNFGIVAQFFDLQYLRHLEFLKYNSKPKLIVVSLDTFSLIKRPDLYISSQFLPNMLFDQTMQKYLSGYREFTKADYYLPLARYAGKPESLSRALQNVFQSREIIVKRKYRGYYALPNEWNEAHNGVSYKKEKYHRIFDPEVIALFERFINECQALGIHLILVCPPEYIENQQYITNREEVMDFYKQLAIKYDLIFLDYSNDEMSYQKDNFFDSIHLTGTGADIFTAKLAVKLKEININH